MLMELYKKMTNALTPVSVEVDNRKRYNDFELKRVGATIFGELSNKGDQSQEARQILSTMLNRAEQGKKSLQSVITEPNQYQAFMGEQYKKFMKGDLDYPSQQKAIIVTNLIDELRRNQFQPVADIKYFTHDKNKSLQSSAIYNP